MLATVLPLAASEESSNFLVSPNVGLMIWTLLAFLVTLFILNKFAFPVIKEALDKRASAIEDSIAAAQKSKEESEALLAEYRERLKEARTQADDIVLRARKNAEAFERDSQDQARQKREELLEQTRKDIDAETRRAIEQGYDYLDLGYVDDRHALAWRAEPQPVSHVEVVVNCVPCYPKSADCLLCQCLQ